MTNVECRMKSGHPARFLHSSFDIRHSSFNLQSRCRMSDVTTSGQTPVPAVEEHHPHHPFLRATMCRPRMKNDECRMKNEERPSRSLSSFFIRHSSFNLQSRCRMSD